MLKKTIFSFCLLSLLSTTTSANATTLSNQEYKKALEKEAEIYDIQISIDSYPVIITYKDLLSKQQEIKCIASQIYTKPSSIINQSSTSYFSNMKVTKNHYSYFDIMAGTSLVCTIKVTLNTTTNIDNYTVLCINSKSASPTSTTTIFKNWKTNSITTNINSPKQGYVNTNTKGSITFSTGGITYSKEISNSLKMKCY